MTTDPPETGAQEPVGDTAGAPVCLAILTLRNEGAFLLDWLAHHRAVGFNRFLVFSNDCQDGTDAMLDRLEALGGLTHVRNDGPYHARGVQFTALNRAAGHPLLREADWILALDIDEFVTLRAGDRSLAALFAALPDATAITLTWRLFGNGGQKRYEDRPVTERFTRCAPEVICWPWRAVMFKTLYRNDGTYGAPGVHRPRRPDRARLAAARWVDTCGRPLPAAFRTGRIFSDYGQPHYALAQLNHYPLGDMESYLLKVDRGRAVHARDRLGMDYWVERNFNTDHDVSALALAAPVRRLRQALMADDRLAALHRSAVAWRRARFETLMRQEPFRALYGRLLMCPPTRPVGREDAAVMIDFARAGGDSDPDR